MTTSSQFHSLRVQRLQAEGADALVLAFDIPPELRDTFAFEPGQYLTLRHGQERRSYSICAAAGEAPRVGVRKVQGGAFSTWLHEHARPGVVLDVMPPQGRFGAALKRQPRHVLAVAGGSGITPILSIVKTLLQRSLDARVTLLYGNRSAATMMFKEELEDLKNRYLTRLVLHAVFSREHMDSPLHAGRLDAQKFQTLLRLSGPIDEAFICGPNSLNDDAERALLAAGLKPDHVHVERFGVPSGETTKPATPQPGDAASAHITIIRDGLTRVVSYVQQDGNLLAAAARAGLEVPYSCKSGVCATCRAKLQQGQVRMERNFALEKDELAAGFILTCQAHPTTEEVVISFDER
jgi:ring-1,2-phenylacetyl-CoA epoxidase subunit PaaE